MKRKVISVLLCSLMICVFSACGILNKPEESVSENGNNETVVSEGESVEENDTESGSDENEEVSAPDSLTSEDTNITEETIASETEEVESTGLSEAELVAIVEAACGKTLEEYGYVYVDMDKDGAYELVATCKEDYVHQIWFCSSDGTVCKMIDENTWGFRDCMLDVVDSDECALVVSQFVPDGGTYDEYIVWRMMNSDIESVMSGEGMLSVDDSGTFYETDYTYTSYWDAEMQSYSGLSWVVYYKEYDYENNKIVYADVTQLTADEFYEYENSEQIIKTIESDEYISDFYKVEYDFYLTSNGKMFVQYKLCEENGNISFYYHILNCEGNKIEELEAGADPAFGDLSELVE